MSDKYAALRKVAESNINILENIAGYAPEDIDGDTVELRFEDENGCDTGCDVSIVAQCQRAAYVIRELLAALERRERDKQEPVAWIVHARAGDQLTQDGDYVANAEGMSGIGSTPLYAAPPASAVTSEPVRYMNRHTGACYTLDQQPDAATDTAVYVPLYAEQPAPVVTKECPAAIRDLMASHSDDLFDDADAQQIWLACRAAMFAAAPQQGAE